MRIDASGLLREVRREEDGRFLAQFGDIVVSLRDEREARDFVSQVLAALGEDTGLLDRIQTLEGRWREEQKSGKYIAGEYRRLNDQYVKLTQGACLTAEECKALYALLDEMSGDNADACFSRDGTDTLTDPTTSALVKVFRAAGEEVPEGL